VSGHRKDIYAKNLVKNHKIAHERHQRKDLRYISILSANIDRGFEIGSIWYSAAVKFTAFDPLRQFARVIHGHHQSQGRIAMGFSQLGVRGLALAICGGKPPHSIYYPIEVASEDGQAEKRLDGCREKRAAENKRPIAPLPSLTVFLWKKGETV
jgi:hypothetical protein